MSPATEAATATVASSGEMRVDEPPMEVGQTEDEERDREEDREVRRLPGRGVVGGVVVLERVEQVADGEHDAAGEQRDALPVTAVRRGHGRFGGDRVDGAGRVVLDLGHVLLLLRCGIDGYGVSAHVRIRRIRVKCEFSEARDCGYSVPMATSTPAGRST